MTFSSVFQCCVTCEIYRSSMEKHWQCTDPAMQNQAKNLGHMLKRQHSYSLPLRSFWERLNYDDVWRQNFGDLVKQSQTLDGQRIWPQSWEGRSSPWNQSLQRLWHFFDRKVFFPPFKIYKSNLLQQVGIKGRAGIARDWMWLKRALLRLAPRWSAARCFREMWDPAEAPDWPPGLGGGGSPDSPASALHNLEQSI